MSDIDVYEPEDAEAPPDDLTYVTVTGVVRDCGSVVLFSGVINDGDAREITFAVDHGPAQDLAYGLDVADYDIEVGLEGWQIVRVSA